MVNTHDRKRASSPEKDPIRVNARWNTSLVRSSGSAAPWTAR